MSMTILKKKTYQKPPSLFLDKITKSWLPIRRPVLILESSSRNIPKPKSILPHWQINKLPNEIHLSKLLQLILTVKIPFRTRRSKSDVIQDELQSRTKNKSKPQSRDWSGRNRKSTAWSNKRLNRKAKSK